MTTIFDDMHCEYSWASGANYQNCAFVGRRWREGIGSSIADSDFYVVGAGPSASTGELSLQYWGPWPNHMTCLWTSLETGRVYVGDASQGSVHVWDEIMNGARPANVTKLGFAPAGMWGLNERELYVWGREFGGPHQKAPPRLARFDGSQWQNAPAPEFRVSKMHGISSDLIYAVGEGGSMARWNGAAWEAVPTPARSDLTDVFVAGPDEFYATTVDGCVLEGTATEWRVAFESPERESFASVVKFAGHVFVGVPTRGLLRRANGTDEFASHKTSVAATHFESRGHALIATCASAIAGTTDGDGFRGTAMNALLRSTNMKDIVRS